MSIACVGHVAIRQFMLGNHMFYAWCKRLGCPEDNELQREVQPVPLYGSFLVQDFVHSILHQDHYFFSRSVVIHR